MNYKNRYHMKNTTHIILTLCILALPGCATLNPLLADLKPIIEDLKPAINDLDVEGIAKDALCDLYVREGREQAEQAFTHDWLFFAGLFQTPPDPAADLLWAQEKIAALGAITITKPKGQSSATALCMVVAFPHDFKDRSIEQRAAVTLHELGHLVEQKRVGCKPWLANYAKASGRTWKEATAYALKDAVSERYGVSPATITKEQQRRVEEFPEEYMLSHVIDSACAERIFTGVRKALRDRTGV